MSHLRSKPTTDMLLRIKLIALLFMIQSVALFSQNVANSSTLLPEPVCLNGKAVYINKYGSVVLSTRFDYFKFANSSFSDGLAGFIENGKYGFIDETGRIIIKPVFDHAGMFSEGFAEIEIDEKHGFIDREGRMIAEPRYDKTWRFKNGFALVGIENGADENDLVKYKWGYLDKSGKIAIGRTRNEFVGKYDDADDFAEGLAPVKIGKKWGYVSEMEQIVIKFQFKEAKSFSEGLAPATLDGKKWGFIDTTGKFAIRPQFTAADEFSEGLAGVSTYVGGYGEWGFIDKAGKMVIKPTFQGVGKFHEGLAILSFGSGGFGYTDRTGKIVIKKPAGGASNFRNGVALFFPNDYGEKYTLYGWGYIDKTGKYIWNPKEKNESYGSVCDN